MENDDPFAEIDLRAAANKAAQQPQLVPPGSSSPGTAEDPYAGLPPAGIPEDVNRPGSAAVFERGAPPLPSLTTGGTTAQPNRYMQAAIEDRDRRLAMGAPMLEGYSSRFMAGPFLGWLPTLSAAATAPAEAYRHGVGLGEGYNYAKARQDLSNMARTENTGTLGNIAEIGGGLAALPRNLFASGLSRVLGGAEQITRAPLAQRIGPALARMAGYGAESGALGAVQGASQGDTAGERAANALRGGAFSAALGAPFGAFAKVAPRSTAAVPSEEELMTLGARDYRARDRLPVGYDSEAVADRLDNLRQATQNRYAFDAPRTVTALDNHATAAYNNVAHTDAVNAADPSAAAAALHTPGQIASIRRGIYNEAAKGTATDERAGTVASKAFDRILTRPNPEMLAPGTSLADASLAASLDARGRSNFGAAYRSKAVTGAVENALNDAAAANSGLNFENRLRQNLNAASKRDEFGNFNPAEQADVQGLIRGTNHANNLRELGNLLGGGGGLARQTLIGGGLGLSGAVGGYLYEGDPVRGAAAGLALGQLGRGIRTYGNKKALDAAEQMAERLRTRSPEYQARAAVAPMGPGPGIGPAAGSTRFGLTLGAQGTIRDALARSLLDQTAGDQSNAP